MINAGPPGLLIAMQLKHFQQSYFYLLQTGLTVGPGLVVTPAALVSHFEDYSTLQNPSAGHAERILGAVLRLGWAAIYMISMYIELSRHFKQPGR